MSKFFLDILNLSITASWLIVAVIATRFIFRKRAPKWVNCLLWSFVGLRLLLPFTIESPFSLSVNREVINTDAVYGEAPEDTVPPVDDTIVPPSVNEGGQTQQKPETENDTQNPDVGPEPAPETDKDKEYIQSGLDVLDDRINPVINGAVSSVSKTEKDPVHKLVSVLSYIWLAGVGAMLTYAVIVYFLLKRRVSASVPCENSVRKSERVDTPFILGIFRPRIYLPFGLSEQTEESVVAHEIAHIKRKDHLIKPLGYAILSVYWFNPLVWVAYILLCRDIESACDEKVINNMNTEARQVYATALLECSIRKNYIAACPLAFGETGVKNRVKNTMNYRKPAFWVIISALMVCVIVSVLFLTSPGKAENDISETISEDSRQTESSDTSVTDVSDDVTSSDVSEYIGEVSVSDEVSSESTDTDVSEEISDEVSDEVSEEVSEEEPVEDNNIPHEHSFEMAYDETGHWPQCECGEKVYPDFGPHDFSNWSEENGYKISTCTYCGYVDREKISAEQKFAYEVNYDGKTCTIVGRGTVSSSHLDIPEEIDGYIVTAIADKAFAYYTSYNKVTIPSTIKVVGAYAFYRRYPSRCIEVNIEDLSAWCSIEFKSSSANPLIYATSIYVSDVAVNDIVIPDDVTEIKEKAFYTAPINSVTFNSKLTTIGKEAFWCCEELSVINNLPENIKIDSKAFAGCYSLKKLTLPDGTVFLGGAVFSNCRALESIEFGNDILEITAGTFSGCTSLKSVVIGEGIEKIGNYAFSGCTALETVLLPHTFYVQDSVIRESVVFEECPDLKEVRYYVCALRYN